MLALILLFSITLALILGLVGYQIVRLRRGEVSSSESYYWPEALIPSEYDFAALRNSITWYAKRGGHLFILLLLKLWIKAVYFVKRKKEILMPKIKAFLYRGKPKETKPGAVSNFLKSVSEYKNKLKHISKKIQEEEIENINK